MPFAIYALLPRRCLTSELREPERPLPPGGHGPRPLPERAGCAEVPLPTHPIIGPHRGRASTMNHAVKASAQRVRDHLHRPIPGRRDPLMINDRNTVSETDPCPSPRRPPWSTGRRATRWGRRRSALWRAGCTPRTLGQSGVTPSPRAHGRPFGELVSARRRFVSDEHEVCAGVRERVGDGLRDRRLDGETQLEPFSG